MKLSEIYRNLVDKGFFGKPEERGVLEEAISRVDNILAEGKVAVIVHLPPGSGKTAIAYSAAFKTLVYSEPWYRVIHALPLRSIIEDIYGRLREGLGKISIGFENVFSKQMFLSENTPYLQSKYVITTFDTFLLELIKLPPTVIRKVSAELSLGHFEVGRASIFSSLIFFDETHLLLEGNSEGRKTLTIVFRFLRKIGVPVVIMTATLPTKLENYIASELEGKIYTIKFSEIARKNVRDEHLERELSKKVEMEKKPIELSNFTEDVSRKLADIGGRRAAIVNTIARAVEIYRKLDVEKKVLLHSQFTLKDRSEKVELLKKAEVAVTTQVIEAGVNVSFDYIISELAPITNVIQRIGRLARFKEKKGLFLIVYDRESLMGNGVYDENYVLLTLKVLDKVADKEVLWHLPSIFEKLGYDKIIDSVWENMSVNEMFSLYSSALNQILSNPMFSSKEALRFVKSLIMLNRGSIIRNDIFATVYLGDEEVSSEEEVFEKAEEKLVPIGAMRLFRQIRRKGVEREVRVVVREDNRVFEEDFTKYNSIRKWCLDWIKSRIVTVRVPTKYYSSEYGLLLH